MTRLPSPDRVGSDTVLWVIATTPEPLTAREITGLIDRDVPTHAHRSVKTALRHLYRRAYVIRRKRERKDTRGGRVPYEYALAPEAVAVDSERNPVIGMPAPGDGDGEHDEGDGDREGEEVVA